MPELPEVETIRRDLDTHLRGKRIEQIIIRHPDVICGVPEQFEAAVLGRRVTGTGRRGKVMWLALDDGQAVAIHLRMSGQTRIVTPGAPLQDHTHLVLRFSEQTTMHYVDPRRFGRLEIIDPQRADESVLLRNIGADALCDGLTAEALCEAAGGHGIGIKEFLLDQTHISGIGNIYASEILHRVGLDPVTPANRVTGCEMQRVLDATRQVLGEAIEACGTTLADARYQSALGRSGEFAALLRVYDREGERCKTEGCAGRIHKRVSGGRSTYLCPECQRTGGRRRPRR